MAIRRDFAASDYDRIGDGFSAAIDTALRSLIARGLGSAMRRSVSKQTIGIGAFYDRSLQRFDAARLRNISQERSIHSHRTEIALKNIAINPCRRYACGPWIVSVRIIGCGGVLADDNTCKRLTATCWVRAEEINGRHGGER